MTEYDRENGLPAGALSYDAETCRDAGEEAGRIMDCSSGKDKNGIGDYRDNDHIYAVLACSGRESDYRYRMIAANHIGGLLPGSCRTIDGRGCIYLDVTSRQNLLTLQQGGTIPGKDIISLLHSLIRTQANLSGYLLHHTGLLLNPELIYRDDDKDGWLFAYYPEEPAPEEYKGSLSSLADYLAYHVEPEDRQAAALCYQLSTLAENPNFTLKEELLMDFAEMEQESTDSGAASEQARDTEQKWQEKISPEQELRDLEQAAGAAKEETMYGTERRATRDGMAVSCFFCILLSAALLWTDKALRLRGIEKISCEAGAATCLCAGMFLLARMLWRYWKGNLQ